jgi:Ca2+:H+ antiporter
MTSLALLIAALVAVVGLAKVSRPLIERGVEAVGLPYAAVAVVIALLVLLPESIAALRAARCGRVQTSLNLAYGSAMASIGLTIPVIAALSFVLGYPLDLGLDATSIVLLAITMFVGLATVLSGRATILQGGLHLSLLAGFLVLVVSP